MGRTAIVAGATGLIGRELVRRLLNDAHYIRVITLVRRSVPLQHEKLTERVVSFEALELDPKLLCGADVYCALGTTIKRAGKQEAFRKVDYEYPARLGKLAAEHGAAQYLIVTAMGADRKSRFFYNQVKGQVEDKLRSLSLPALHIFRPSLLLGDREQFRFGEQAAAVAMKLFGGLLIGPLSKYKAIQGRSVAEAMVHTALTAERGIHIYESDKIAGIADRA